MSDGQLYFMEQNFKTYQAERDLEIARMRLFRLKREAKRQLEIKRILEKIKNNEQRTND